MKLGSGVLRASIALLSGLLLWAAWFTLAYAFHGAQCAGSVPLTRTAGQITQIAIWAAAVGVIIVQKRLVERWNSKQDMAPGLLRSARYLQLTAVGATIFVGLPILVLAPC